jgi:alkylhydroperoxidase family enzyme
MLRAVINSRLDVLEKQLGESIEYTRHILRTSLRLFFKFLKFTSFAQHRKACPAEPYFVAATVAAREFDCGPCVQICVNQARQSGVPADVLQAVLDRRVDDLPEELADAYRFAEAVVTASGDEDYLRERLRERYGEEGLIELAYGIAAAGVFPTVKRALGYAQSCSRVALHV